MMQGREKQTNRKTLCFPVFHAASNRPSYKTKFLNIPFLIAVHEHMREKNNS